jgi:hypothetical protein
MLKATNVNVRDASQCLSLDHGTTDNKTAERLTSAAHNRSVPSRSSCSQGAVAP